MRVRDEKKKKLSVSQKVRAFDMELYSETAMHFECMSSHGMSHCRAA